MKKLLLIFAHPDDESFTCGGTIAKYYKNGWKIDLLVATRGEAGQTGSYGKISIDKIADIRQAEQQKAAKILGISTVTFFDYPDGNLSNVNPGELEAVLYNEMLEMSPDIVITFEPRGISNHPDHMKISRATTNTYYRYAKDLLYPKKRGSRDPDGYKEAFKQNIPISEVKDTIPKLYQVCTSKHAVNYLKKHNIIPNESYDKPREGIPDKHITTVIDITRFASKKKKALQSHISQLADIEKHTSFSTHPMFQHEYFILRYYGIQEVYMGRNDSVSNRL
ncbi:PIG-L deacetylase family protein [Patescibacteria group bacterium]